jgi:hypothetical protein
MTLLVARCSCGQSAESRHETERECLRELREAGWRWTPHHMFSVQWHCPKCAEPATNEPRGRHSPIGFCPRCKRNIYIPFINHEEMECEKPLFGRMLK